MAEALISPAMSNAPCIFAVTQYLPELTVFSNVADSVVLHNTCRWRCIERKSGVTASRSRSCWSVVDTRTAKGIGPPLAYSRGAASEN